MKISQRKNKGFTILYAVLISGLLLSIGVSIASLSIRELALVGGAEQSTSALFAADAGAECAMYWDFKGLDGVFATTSTYTPIPSSFVETVTCGTNTTLSLTYGTEGLFRTSKFTMYLDSAGSAPDTNGRCAVVNVKKRSIDGTTEIDSRGFNTCSTANPKVVERGIRINY